MEFVRKVSIEHSQLNLCDFLGHELHCSKKQAKRLLDARVVFVNGYRVWMARHQLRSSDLVEAYSPLERLEITPERVIFEDNDYLVINKLPGYLSNGRDSIESTACKWFPKCRIKAVHRLDRDTSGCLLLAKSKNAFSAIVPVFKSQGIDKIYYAIAEGKFPERLREIDKPLDGRSAVTQIQILSATDKASLLKIKIPTGRTHQIRKHLTSVHHRVLGDKVYGVNQRTLPYARSVPRQMLHAYALKFRSPLSGKVIEVNSSLPADFESWRKQLQLEPSKALD